MDVDPKKPRIDLDIRQTRRLHLAGSVAFPTPFPSVGGISIEKGSLRRSAGGNSQDEAFVIVREESGLEQATSRVFLQEDVAGIFFPGVWVETDKERKFRFAEQDFAYDLEKGEWFLKPHIDAHEINMKLKTDITDPESGARGIAFVPEDEPVLTITESTQTAGTADEASPVLKGCEREW